MGAKCTSVSGNYKEAKLRSEEIDRQLNQFASQESGVSKMLLLGKKLTIFEIFFTNIPYCSSERTLSAYSCEEKTQPSSESVEGWF